VEELELMQDERFPCRDLLRLAKTSPLGRGPEMPLEDVSFAIDVAFQRVLT
jgi:hypothetical protein